MIQECEKGRDARKGQVKKWLKGTTSQTYLLALKCIFEDTEFEGKIKERGGDMRGVGIVRSGKDFGA